MKRVLLTLTVMMSLPLQAKTLCRVSIDGKPLAPVQSPVAGGLAFSAGDTTVIAESVPEKPNRLRFTVFGPAKAAYVVAAFRDERLQIRPEINGQQMALSCLRK